MIFLCRFILKSLITTVYGIDFIVRLFNKFRNPLFHYIVLEPCLDMLNIILTMVANYCLFLELV